MVAVQSPLLTPEEYLAIERDSAEKHEYVAGEVVAMAGASRRHNLIQTDTGTSLNVQLRDRPCEVYPSDMRVKVSTLGIYTYPDITVVCGEPDLEDAEQDTLLNPTVIIEVLSPATERYDRGLKFHRYQLIPSLRDYLLIAQDRPWSSTMRVVTMGVGRNLSMRVYPRVLPYEVSAALSRSLRSIGRRVSIQPPHHKSRGPLFCEQHLATGAGLFRALRCGGDGLYRRYSPDIVVQSSAQR
jgi:Uma2 family endonuclease